MGSGNENAKAHSCQCCLRIRVSLPKGPGGGEETVGDSWKGCLPSPFLWAAGSPPGKKVQEQILGPLYPCLASQSGLRWPVTSLVAVSDQRSHEHVRNRILEAI